MKKVLKLFTFMILSYFLLLSSTYAASLSMSRSSSKVSIGKTVKITVKVTGATSYTYSNFAISYDEDRFSFVSSSDNCNGLNCLIEGNNNVTLTFKAKSNGDATFKATGSFEDDTSGSLSASSKVTVGEVEEAKTLDSNNNLASLSIEGYNLTPEFNKDTLEYTINLPGTTESINIAALAEAKTSKVTNAGIINVTEGVNVIEVIVTAENGSKKTYILKVNEDEKEPIEVIISDKNYTVVRNKELLTKPENYEEKIITINEKEVPAFYSEITKFTLVGLKNNEGKISLYIYNESKNSYSIYNEVKFNSIVLYPMESKKSFKDYKKYTIDINGIEVKGYKIDDNSLFAIVYGMDTSTGQENYYMYDLDNNTIQEYNDEHINKLYKDLKLYTYVILSSASLLILCFIIIIVLCVKNKNRKKKIKNILNKLSATETEEKSYIINEEEIVQEVIEESENDDQMYDLFEDD